MHGTTMIFLAVMPLSVAFFNYIIPLQIGARDVAFPRLNAFRYWVFLFGGLFMNISFLLNAAPNGGWFGYARSPARQFSPALNIDFWVLGLQILGVASLAGGVQLHHHDHQPARAGHEADAHADVHLDDAGHRAFLLILAFPVITVALILLMFDRFFGTNFFTSAAGGDPLLWQHLFWIFGHPEVYILILPAFGHRLRGPADLLAASRSSATPVMVYSGMLIAFLGFGVWATTCSPSAWARSPTRSSSLATMLIAIPTGVKIFNWIGTMWGGSIRFTTAM